MVYKLCHEGLTEWHWKGEVNPVAVDALDSLIGHCDII